MRDARAPSPLPPSKRAGGRGGRPIADLNMIPERSLTTESG